jgi:hypothetical protein
MRFRSPFVAVAAAALVLVATSGVTAQNAAGRFDVIEAIEGVWAYDPYEVADLGDFTCEERPLAMLAVDGGRRLASKRLGDEAERYGLILDVRNDYPLGPALSVVWEDAPTDATGAPVATVLVMHDPDSFSAIDGATLNAYLAGAPGLERSRKRARCVEVGG